MMYCAGKISAFKSRSACVSSPSSALKHHGYFNMLCFKLPSGFVLVKSLFRDINSFRLLVLNSVAIIQISGFPL